MPAEFESFCESYVGEFIESLVGARGCLLGGDVDCPDPPEERACCMRISTAYIPYRICLDGMSRPECEAINGDSWSGRLHCEPRLCDFPPDAIGACCITRTKRATQEKHYSCMGPETIESCKARAHSDAEFTWATTFKGDHTTCANALLACREEVGTTAWGACCYIHSLHGPSCAYTSRGICEGGSPGWQDGIFQGEYVSCAYSGCEATKGACCGIGHPTNCTKLPAYACRDRGGIFLGYGSTCHPDTCPGACCLGCARCVDKMTKGNCTELAGEWKGSGVPCANAECPEGPLLN